MRNKYLAFGGAVAGLGLIIGGVTFRKKPSKHKQTEIPEYVVPLVSIVGEDTVRMIATDPAWTELADRASEFYVLAKEECKELLNAIARVVAFQVSLQVNEKVNFGTPRLFRTRLHAVVEAVRDMRAVVIDKCPSAIDDFDEVAADIQRAHDDAAYNLQLEATA